MKTMMIAAIVIGLLVVAGIAMVNANIDDPTETQNNAISDASPSCSGCGNGCSAEKNCGLATCGAVNGGSCGCNKK